MAKRYEFVTDESDIFIPIDDGEYEVSGMSADFSTGQCYVQFYDVDKEPVTPSAGTVTFKASPFEGDQWLGSSNSAEVIDVTTVESGDSTYTTPKFSGCVVATKMVLDGITGAVYVSAFHWRE